MVVDELSHLRDLLQIYRRRLHILEGQVALFGKAFSPPHVLIELEDARTEVRRVERRIEDISSVLRPPSPNPLSGGSIGQESKSSPEHFDVFLCHNSEDKPAVKQIGLMIKEQGISAWLDEWELRPGLPWKPLLEAQIGKIDSAAVFVGDSGFGPWQVQEMYALLDEFVARGSPVIPVLLQNAPSEPQLPIFLKGMTWVNFKVTDPDPLDQLIFGIRGKKRAE